MVVGLKHKATVGTCEMKSPRSSGAGGMLPNSLLKLISLLGYTVPKINLDKFCGNLGREVYIWCVCCHSWGGDRKRNALLSDVVLVARGAR